ncbi:MAG: class I SAM-dependent methyltransferase [Candidatus Omnitrophota bacterium]
MSKQLNEISRAWSERHKSKEHYVRFQFLAAEEEISSYDKFVTFKGKKVLDVGCGLGGKTVRYAQCAGCVVAVDCNLDDLLFAGKFSRSSGAPVHFTRADIHSLPFKDNFFDIVILNDIIEHVCDPLRALRECKRVLVPGGILFMNFPPFYGPQGGHVGYYFSVPWVHLLPRRVVKWLLLRKEPKEGWFTPQSISDDFNSTNRMAIRRCKRYIARTGWKVKYCDIRPCNHRIKSIITWPLINELLAENIHFVLEK